MKILLISRKELQCGVADYGKRLYDILRPHFDITFREVETLEDCSPGGYDIVLYNYHHATLDFIKDDILTRGVKHYAIYHEGPLHWTPDKIIDTSIRPIIEDAELLPVLPTFTVGSFGFGFPDKNLPGICQMVRDQFIEATIRLNIPFAYYGDRDGFLAMREADKCREVLQGTSIDLQISHDYKTQADLIAWLSQHHVNLFLYTASHGRGLASATDYALSAYRPVGVNDSEMFRHLPLEMRVTDIRDLHIVPEVYEQHSNKRLVEKYKQCLL